MNYFFVWRLVSQSPALVPVSPPRHRNRHCKQSLVNCGRFMRTCE
jgi:hypothetical protein